MNISPHVKYCLCTSCWFTLARSAFEPLEFIRQAEQLELSYEQRKTIDKMKLQLWNESVEGESA